MTVQLKINGGLYDGWQSVSIDRRLDRMAGSFSLQVTDKWDSRQAPWNVRPGDACTIETDGDLLITGYVDAVEPRYTGTDRAIRVSGRSRTGDLIDCSVDRPSDQWTNRTLDSIAADICAPFGIRVTSAVSTGAAFPTFKIDPGESAYQALEELARQRALLATDDENGNLVFTRAGDVRADTPIVAGRNVLEAAGRFSFSERHSSITVKAQQKGSDDVPGTVAAGSAGSANDAGVPRHRPLVLVQTVPLDSAACRDVATHEAAVRFGRSGEVVYTLQGWRQQGGALWRPNMLVRVTDPSMQLDRDMLIAGVGYRFDDAGEKVDLDVIRPEAYQLIAGAAKPTRSGDKYAEILAEFNRQQEGNP